MLHSQFKYLYKTKQMHHHPAAAENSRTQACVSPCREAMETMPSTGIFHISIGRCLGLTQKFLFSNPLSGQKIIPYNEDRLFKNFRVRRFDYDHFS